MAGNMTDDNKVLLSDKEALETLCDKYYCPSEVSYTNFMWKGILNVGIFGATTIGVIDLSFYLGNHVSSGFIPLGVLSTFLFAYNRVSKVGRIITCSEDTFRYNEVGNNNDSGTFLNTDRTPLFSHGPFASRDMGYMDKREIPGTYVLHNGVTLEKFVDPSINDNHPLLYVPSVDSSGYHYFTLQFSPSDSAKAKDALSEAVQTGEKQCVIGKVIHHGYTSGVFMEPTRIMPALYREAA